MIILIMVIPIIISILIFLGVLKLINKFIFKNNVKINLKEIIIGWCIIFCFNLFCVISDFAYPIGVTISPYFDAGKTKYCASLGYIIEIKKDSVINHYRTYVSFFTLNKKHEWNMKITGGTLGDCTFYFYDNNKLVVDDTLHGTNEYQWKEKVDINQIYDTVKNRPSDIENDKSFCIELEDGVKKYIDFDDEYMKAFFNSFQNYILK